MTPREIREQLKLIGPGSRMCKEVYGFNYAFMPMATWSTQRVAALGDEELSMYWAKYQIEKEET